LQEYFNIEYPENTPEEEKTLENAILIPKVLKIKLHNGDILEVPVCTLVSMNHMDIKNINIKTEIEIKNLKQKDILMCAKNNGKKPSINLDINLESIEVSENINRLIQKFNI
jgi:sucrose-6-phosphate hydrolase SacC (GH32 family)